MAVEKKILVEASCPECRGPLSRIQTDGPPEFQCLVGHRYSVASVLALYCETEERLLWSAVVALEETVPLVESMVDSLDSEVATRLKKQAEERKHLGAQVREIIRRLEPFQLQ